MSGQRNQSASADAADKAGAEGPNAAGARAIVHEGDTDHVPPCPICNAPMEPVLRDDVILFYGCSRYHENGCRGRWSFERDRSGDPMDRLVLMSCPECHQGLRKGYGRNGRPYCACFESAQHRDGQTIFFDEEGRPRAGNWTRSRFTCPECGSPLVNFVVQSGARKGRRTFACFAAARHVPKGPHYWDEVDGEPVW